MQARTLHDVIGYSGRLSYLLGRICGAVPGLGYARHLLMTVPAENIPSMPKGYAARVLSALDLTGQEIDASPQIQAARLAAGMVCIGAFDSKDRLVGVTWLGKGAMTRTCWKCVSACRVMRRGTADCGSTKSGG
jgi:hypothetical protein